MADGDRGVRAALFGTNESFRVVIGGRGFSSWEEIVLDRAIDAACGTFSVKVVSPQQVASRGTAAGRSRAIDSSGVLYELPFGPQDAVEVTAVGELMLTGRVDALEAELDQSGGTRVQLAGRDRAADMVDCSAPNKPGEWFNVGLRDLARELAAPFGLEVAFNSDPGAIFPTFRLQESESAWGALERACRMRGLLCFSDPFGNLVVEAPGAGGIDGGGRIGQGENLVHAQLSLNDAERFSIYTVRGQRPGAIGGYGSAAVLIEGNALDAGVQRFRPLVVLAESAVSPADAQLRAQWEAVVRASRAHRLVCKVPGWRRPLSSRPWRINTLVPVNIPRLGINAELLIMQTIFRRSRREGTSTELVLVRPDAFRPQPDLQAAADPLTPAAFDTEEP